MSLKNIIKAANGEIYADFVLKNGRIIDVLGHRIVEGNVAVKDGIIIGIGDYIGKEEIDVRGAFIAPGFVDSHVHIESAMITPSEYANIIMPKGVTTIIADPHEIANVCGEDGLKFMIEDSKNVPLDIHFVLPSCVPATPFDSAGCVIDGDYTKELFEKYDFLGLGEMMNYPGVINCVPDVLKKLESSTFIDGHAPMVSGYGLNAYICGGIDNDHECQSYKEALEKISKGLNIFIREGTGAKNLRELIKAVNPYNLRHFSFCTDDKDISDILEEGTISHCVDLAIRLGLDPIDAYTIACYNTGKNYNLGKVGAIAPGYKADIIVTKDINATVIKQVYKNGQLVAGNGMSYFDVKPSNKSKVTNTVNIKKITPSDFKMRYNPNEPVISINKGSLVTDGVYREYAEDLSLCANIERHKATGNIGKCFVQGVTIENGAIAQTIGHDSHNITVIGSDGENMCEAINALGKNGGIAVVKNKEVIAFMELEVGGLMSSKPAKIVSYEHSKILDALREICPGGSGELSMIVSFISLLVIPHLKLSDRGLFDVDEFKLL
ncbi:MAG: adenine deaminase [Lachnospirales bacterium]